MPKTLLLADDSVVIQKLVGLSFANIDVELITADDGDAAIALARTHRPDAVIADVIMPGRSGYEVCEALQQDPALCQTPVLLLTGTFEAFDEERARQVGAVGHINKPFEAQVLVERVTELFETGMPSDGLAAPADLRGERDELADPFDLFEDDLADLTAAALVPERGLERSEDPLADLTAPGESVPMPTEISHHDLDLDLDLVDLSLESDLADDGLDPLGPIGSEAFAPQPPDESPDWLAPGIAEPPPEAPALAGAPATLAPPPIPPAPAEETIVALGASSRQAAARREAEADAAATAALEALPEAVRERMQDTLEKIAWEAFSDLSEQVVRQVLERVETIAWEVIPQLTETLIREEIRRLKDDTPPGE